MLNCAELKEEKSGFSHGWLVVRKSNFPVFVCAKLPLVIRLSFYLCEFSG